MPHHQYSQQMRPGLAISSRTLIWLAALLLLIWCVGMFGRNYWTPDEPREAAIAWRMSWQADKAVPLLAGEAFCEKPPLTYWMAAVPMKLFGEQAWAARLPNLLYALITALSVGWLAARSTGRFAGLVAAAAVSTFLLSYQVAIWLATDAPLLAAVSVALLGAYVGFYATARPERLRGYLLMHAALGLGFLSKSAVAWMVPALTLFTLIIWEKRWRELFRWELYVGLLIHAAMILTWVWFVYVGDHGPAHLKVFFWNNLVGRFATLDVPPELQYATGHRNTPGKYLLELPIYLFPWTLLVLAALRRAWLRRRTLHHDDRAVRFGLAASLPSLVILSVAATARNIYFAPALPGIALLVGWWAREIRSGTDRWDVRALRATAVLLLLGVVSFIAALVLIAWDAWGTMGGHTLYILISGVGLYIAAAQAMRAWGSASDQAARAQWSLFIAYCALLIGPASQVYRQADAWQDLAKIGRAVEADAVGKRLVLLAPDETTRAMIDMYARTSVDRIDAPLDARAAARVEALAATAPHSVFLVQLPAQRAQALGQFLRRPEPPTAEPLQPWMQQAQLRISKRYALPHGRRYALLEIIP
jgi:4-amino-4-deoxy-L-arabinose transferase-like glycosyltransferase